MAAKTPHRYNCRLQTRQWSENTIRKEKSFRSVRRSVDIRTGLSIHPYCNQVKRDPLETECTEDRLSVALCILVHRGHMLPPPFQNHDNIPHVPKTDVENCKKTRKL